MLIAPYILCGFWRKGLGNVEGVAEATKEPPPTCRECISITACSSAFGNHLIKEYILDPIRVPILI